MVLELKFVNSLQDSMGNSLDSRDVLAVLRSDNPGKKAESLENRLL